MPRYYLAQQGRCLTGAALALSIPRAIGAEMQAVLQRESACRRLSSIELKKEYEECMKRKLAEKRNAQ